MRIRLSLCAWALAALLPACTCGVPVVGTDAGSDGGQRDADGGGARAAAPAVRQVVSGAGRLEGGPWALDAQLGGAVSPGAAGAAVQPEGAVRQ